METVEIEPTTQILQVSIAKALEHVPPYFAVVSGVEPESLAWNAKVLYAESYFIK